MKKIKLFQIICIIPLFLCGCRGTEVQDRKYAEYAYIKSFNSNVSAEVSFFQSDEKINGIGNSLSEALVECSKKTGCDIFAGHMEFIVLQADNPLDILIEIKKECDIPDSCKIIFASSHQNKIPNNDCIEEYEKTLSLPVSDVSNSLDSFLSPSKSALIPSLNNNTLNAAVVSSNGNTINLSDDALKGAGIFHSKTKKTWLFMNDKSYSIYSIKRKICISKKNDTLRITFKLLFKSKNPDISELENQTAFYIEKYVNETIKKGCDTENVADLIQQKEYSFFMKHKDEFSSLLENSVCNVCINGRLYSLAID